MFMTQAAHPVPSAQEQLPPYSSTNVTFISESGHATSVFTCLSCPFCRVAARQHVGLLYQVACLSKDFIDPITTTDAHSNSLRYPQIPFKSHASYYVCVNLCVDVLVWYVVLCRIRTINTDISEDITLKIREATNTWPGIFCGHSASVHFRLLPNCGVLWWDPTWHCVALCVSVTVC